MQSTQAVGGLAAVQTLVPVRYIGAKAQKHDILYGTKIVWHGPGDVQLVPSAHASKFLAHDGVWVHGDRGWTEPTAESAPAPADIPPELAYGWARDLLSGTAADIRERLTEQSNVLALYPPLWDALLGAEQDGRNRRNVLDLLRDAQHGPAHANGDSL